MSRVWVPYIRDLLKLDDKVKRYFVMNSVANILDTIQARSPVSAILETLWTAGFQAFLAGGAVRDALLGLAPADVDILTNALPKDLSRLFAEQDPRYVGKSFAVTLVNKVEVATCRPADKKAVAAGLVFPATDLGRRDLTINSMAWDPETRTLADPFAGRRTSKTRRFDSPGIPLTGLKKTPYAWSEPAGLLPVSGSKLSRTPLMPSVPMPIKLLPKDRRPDSTGSCQGHGYGQAFGIF